MRNIVIEDTGYNEVTAVDKGEQAYPYSFSQKLYIHNLGVTDAENIMVCVKPEVSVQNFSSPALIQEAKIEDLFGELYFNYAELLFVADNKVVDIANFPTKELIPGIDPDGYCRNILHNIKIKFNHTSHNGNSRIYLSEAHNLAGVSKDISGTPEGYQRSIVYSSIPAGERIAFWYRFFLRKDLTGEKDPHIFNLLIRGD